MRLTQPVLLEYGRAPLVAHVPATSRRIGPVRSRVTTPLDQLLRLALENPIGGVARLRDRAGPGSRITIVLSDDTRDEPRLEMFAAVVSELGTDQVTVAIANGTHRPGDTAWATPLHRVVMNHDASDDSVFVEVGSTSRGTRVRFPKWLLEQHLVITTGRIRPHYFAGFGAGLKGVFPGLGHAEDIRQNHRLKRDPSARLGRVDDNICRLDMEEAAGLLPAELFLLNVVLDDEGRAHDAFAGDPMAAFRAGASSCAELCTVHSAPADVVVVSDRLPVTASLYQASKLLAPAAQVLRPGGVVVLVAECPDGTGPLATVNEGIYELGLRHHLPTPHRVYLVSSMPEAVVRESYCEYAPSVEWVLDRHGGEVTVLPRAASLMLRRV